MTINSISDYLFNLSATATDSKKAQTNSGNLNYQFKDILSSTTDKKVQTSTRDDNSSIDSESYAKKQNDLLAQGKTTKTYREIVDSRNSDTNTQDANVKQVSDNYENTGAVKGDSTEVKDTKGKAEAILESLAQVLGLTPAELTKLLASLNIKPEDLADESKAEEIAGKIAQTFGLDSNDENTLSTILKGTNELFDSMVTKPVKTDNSTNIAEAPSNNTNSKQELQADTDTSKVPTVIVEDMGKIMVKFKQNLHQLSQKLQQNPQTVTDEISEKIQSVMAKPVDEKVGQTNSIQQKDTLVQTDNQNGNDKVKGTVEAKSGKNEDLTQNNDNSGSKTSESVKTVVADAGHKPDVDSNGNTIQFDNLIANQPQKTDTLFELSKLQKDVNVSKSEIFDQVVEKAKVTLNDGKTEMVMDLRPESLGKLSLKLVTERGIVVAKFVAESQQVKETLEANMQLLKDSLQKQGLTVQDCSVSVGQESFNGFNRSGNTSNGERASGGNQGTDTVNGVNIADIPETRTTVNPYDWNESSINLTA